MTTNQKYKGLLEDGGMTQTERMDSIAKLLHEMVNEVSANLQSDARIDPGMMAKSLKRYADEKFKKMAPELWEEYGLEVHLRIVEEGGWKPTLTYKPVGYFERSYRRGANFGGGDSVTWGTINTSHISAGTIAASQVRTGPYTHTRQDAIDAINRGPQMNPNMGRVRDMDLRGAAIIPTTFGEGRIAPEPPEGYWARGQIGEAAYQRLLFENGSTIETPVRVRERMGTMILSDDAVAQESPLEVPPGGFPTLREVREFDADFGGGTIHAPDLFVDLNEVREATWGTRSLTDDMREVNQQRIIQSIQTDLRRLMEEERAAGGVLRLSESELRARAAERLERHQARGSIQGFDTSIEYRTEQQEVVLCTNVWPTASMERIQIGVTLRD